MERLREAACPEAETHSLRNEILVFGVEYFKRSL
jgi:hypothetical protein